ncbi:alpha/beta hydrolase-fold protein [Rhizomicrobium electricum]|jgi:enterochelin esterase-like enzyme|uniref:Alpha/beta hydrolase-fold protein n=2 Tax=Rhizomicrobium electricum TaxID=480070 RepID=A0ABP3Q1M1_9PROT
MWRWLAYLLMIAAAEAAPGTLLAPEMMSAEGAGPMVVTVWLPPGYQTSTERYPVLYMQDGQNLFDGAERATSWNRHVWGADTVAAELIAAGKIPPVIIVGIDHKGPERARQYYPQAAFGRLDPAVQRQVMTAPPYSDAYLRFLVNELKPIVDARFRTRGDRASTFVMGSSMGGLISLYAFAEHPEIFGGAGCLSTHWLMAAPGPAAPTEQLFSAYENYLRDKNLKPGRLWFDHGTIGLDAHYDPYQARIDALLVGKGWKLGVDYVSKTYPGADHNEDAWRERLGESLIFLLGGH